jgi:hypothetical protein
MAIISEQKANVYTGNTVAEAVSLSLRCSRTNGEYVPGDHNGIPLSGFSGGGVSIAPFIESA